MAPTTTRPVEKVLAVLEGVRQVGPDQWEARCPAHDDSTPSLSVGVGEEERALAYCHAGCALADVRDAAGLQPADLFPPKAETKAKARITATYGYTDEAGELLYEVVRFDPKDFRQRRPNGSGGWEWRLNGVRRTLYRLPEVLEAVATDRTVWVVEGEKDADSLARAGEVATCNPGGAGKWSKVPDAADQLAGASIIVWVDNDEPGHKHGRQVVASIDGHAAGWIVVRSRHAKDAADHVGQGRPLSELEELAASDGDRTWLDGKGLDSPREIQDDDDEPLPEPPDEMEQTTWEPIDLADVLAGDHEPIIPTVGRIGDGPGAIALFYLGRINGLFGESGSGKSWVADAITAQEINDGFGVLRIDLEDDAAGQVARLLALGVSEQAIADHLVYVHPDLPLRPEAFQVLADVIAAKNVRLAVLDSLGEVMSLEGVEDKDGPVTAFMQRFPRWLARQGPAVVPIDHVPKAKDAPLDYAIGSQRKRGAVTGALYRVDQFHKMAQGRTGAVKLTVAKDRLGTRPKGTVATEITFDATTEARMIATLNAPSSAGDDGEFRPTTLMTHVSDWLERNPGDHSQRDVLGAVKGNREAKRTALARLVEEGFTAMESAGQAHRYSHLRRFTE